MEEWTKINEKIGQREKMNIIEKKTDAIEKLDKKPDKIDEFDK